MPERLMRHHALAIVVMFGTGGFLLAQAQEPAAIFRSRVDVVEVDAYVTDAQGRPVTNLTAADFQILENGKPQTLASFSIVDLPVERTVALPRTLEPDVRGNDAPEGRLYVFAI